MPYINLDRREAFKEVERLDWIGLDASNAGELNYLITQIILGYWNQTEFGVKQNYQRINDIMGALESAKQEFYRRVVVPYEEKKMKENGDVY